MKRTKSRGTKMVTVTCHASHPDPKVRGACGHELGRVLGPLRFIETKPRKPESLDDDRTWLKCGRRDCRTWNVFEVTSE